jgi:HK97 gp10 family phage protein
MANGDVQVHIEGVDVLLQRMKFFGVAIDRVLEKAATAGAEIIAEAANEKAPEPLITTETKEKKKSYAVVGVGPPEEKWYWRYVETGAQPHTITGNPLIFYPSGEIVVTGLVNHPGMAARPFLRPAFDNNTQKAADAVGDEIIKIFESTRGGLSGG